MKTHNKKTSYLKNDVSIGAKPIFQWTEPISFTLEEIKRLKFAYWKQEFILTLLVNCLFLLPIIQNKAYVLVSVLIIIIIDLRFVLRAFFSFDCKRIIRVCPTYISVDNNRIYYKKLSGISIMEHNNSCCPFFLEIRKKKTPIRVGLDTSVDINSLSDFLMNEIGVKE